MQFNLNTYIYIIYSFCLQFLSYLLKQLPNYIILTNVKLLKYKTPVEVGNEKKYIKTILYKSILFNNNNNNKRTD